MIKINLVPQDILDQRAQKQQIVLVGLAAAAIGVVLAGISYSHYNKRNRLELELQDLNAKLAVLQEKVDLVNKIKAETDAVNLRLTAIESLTKVRELYPRFMIDLLKTLPEGVWLAGLTTTGGGAELGIVMESRARSAEDVSEWLRTLAKPGHFEKSTIGGITVDSMGQHVFTMTVRYKAEPAVEAK